MTQVRHCSDVFVFMDPHSESLLAQVHPVLADRARNVVAALLPHDARIISGFRTYAEQNAEYAKGRFGNPGPRVTNARGGQSNHNFGLAADIGIFENGKYLQESSAYNLIQAAAHAAGLESGADWKHINDRPHIQLHSDLIVNGSPTNACRDLFAKGGLPAIFAHVSAVPPVITPAPVVQPPILRLGSKGEAVALLQAKLRGLGYTLPIDGSFGNRTETCVKRFQASEHLDEDGVVGAATRRALGL